MEDEVIFNTAMNVTGLFKEIIIPYGLRRGLFIGIVPITEYTFDEMGAYKFDENDSKDNSLKWYVSTYLPNFKTFVGRFRTEEECKLCCIGIAKVFINRLSSSPNSDASLPFPSE